MSEEAPPVVDTSLIDEMMAMTVKERLQQNDRTIRMALRLREAVRLAEQGADAESE